MEDSNTFPRQGHFEDESEHVPGAEFGDPFLGPDAAVSGSLEDTQAALQAEQDDRDGLIEDEPIPRPWNDLTDSSNTTFHLIAEMATELGNYVKHVEGLYEIGGLDRDTLTIEIPFNMLGGGLLVGTLQLAGIVVPEIRPQIDAMLDHVEGFIPTPSDEQKAALQTATKKMLDSRVESFRQAAEDAGMTVLVEGEDDEAIADIIHGGGEMEGDASWPGRTDLDDAAFDARNN